LSRPHVIFYVTLGPYHIARLKALGSKLPDIVAIEIASQQDIYLWTVQGEVSDFKRITLFKRQFESVPVKEQIAAAQGILAELSPVSVTVVGYSDPVMRGIARWAFHNRVPCIMTTTTTVYDHFRIPPKEWVKGWWCRRYYDALCLAGERSVAYFAGLGYSEKMISRCGNPVDNSFYDSMMLDINADPDRARAELKLPERYFLTVARLSPEKNFVRLLKAFSGYREKGGTWDLVIVGSGPQELELKQFAEDLNLAAVHFFPWKQYNELPAYYALASCFVLASISEPWGLVLNEAMACGLPVLVSRQCGCLHELCRRGINGYDFNPKEVETLTDLMLRIASDEQELERMGRASQRIIANFTPETWALSLRECILTCLARGPRHRSRGGWN
jgi:1,2-diacylglycerol 3-alpha-glucosyltransferase